MIKGVREAAVSGPFLNEPPGVANEFPQGKWNFDRFVLASSVGIRIHDWPSYVPQPP